MRTENNNMSRKLLDVQFRYSLAGVFIVGIFFIFIDLVIFIFIVFVFVFLFSLSLSFKLSLSFSLSLSFELSLSLSFHCQLQLAVPEKGATENNNLSSRNEVALQIMRVAL